MKAFRRSSSLLLAGLALVASPAAAFDLADGKLDLGVSGDAAYGRTDGNTFDVGDEEGRYDNTILGISVIGHVGDHLTIGSRIDFEGGEGAEAEVDWAFAEWKVSDRLRFRAGKAKHPFGNMGEIKEEGILRLFFSNPVVIYGPAEIVGDGYTGAGLTGFLRVSDRWSLTYDLYGGELDTEENDALPAALDPALAPGALEEDEGRELIGARLSVETPIPGLVARLSGFTLTEEADDPGEEDSRRSAVALSGEYLGESLTVRAEYAFVTETDDYTTNAAYVEGAWKFRSGVELAARVQGSWTELEGFSGSSPFLRHQEASVGVNYWFDPDFVVRASYHFVDGNRFAVTTWDGVSPATRPVEETTHLFVVGAQFAL